MSIYELDTSWAGTANERRRLQWELLACDKVRGVFFTAREDTLAVLFSGDRNDFRAWARTLARSLDLHSTPTTNEKGALR